MAAILQQQPLAKGEIYQAFANSTGMTGATIAMSQIHNTHTKRSRLEEY